MKKFLTTAVVLAVMASVWAVPAEFPFAGNSVIRVVNAKTGRVLDGKYENGVFKCTSLQITVTPGTSGKYALAAMRFAVNGDERFFLTVEVEKKGLPAENFYNGQVSTPVAKEKLEHKTMLDTFPLAAVWSRQRGFAAGIAPTTVASYLYSSFDPAEQKFIYRTHVVADNKRVQDMDLIAAEFEPEFGYNQALENYYDAYPEYFRPHPGVDERIYGVMGYFLSAHKSRDLEINSGRHFSLQLEWTYAPFVEAGNWYTNKEDWIQGTHICTNYDALRKHRAVTWDEYHAARVKQFESGDRQAAMYHYLLVKSINRKVAEKFNDAITRDELGRISKSDGMHQTPWEVNKTQAVFPYGSKLKDHLEHEIAEIVANYKVSGFSFDMVNYNLNSYAPSQLEYAVGRDFDKKFQVFTPDTVVPVPFANYIHTLKRDNKTMGVFVNFAFNRMAAHTAFAVDGGMIECTPDFALGASKTLRVLAGQKPLSYFLGFGIRFHNKGIRWNEVNTPEKTRAVVDGLAYFMLFNCLRYGYSPMNWNLEYRDRSFFQPYLPLILRIKKAGWRPVTAVRTIPEKVPFWIGRFGKGDESVITITNPERHAVKAKFSIVKKHLGEGKLVPVVLHGNEVKFTDNGTVIDFEYTLEAKGILAIAMKDAKRENQTRIVGDKAAVAAFFTPDDAAGSRVTAVVPEAGLKVLYDFIDRYYPYVAAARKHTGKPFCREPGFMDASFNDIWRMPLTTGAAGTAGKKIVIATAAQLPELQAEIAALPAGDGLVKLQGDTLYLTGKDAAAVRRAVMSYLEILDEVEKNRKIR